MSSRPDNYDAAEGERRMELNLPYPATPANARRLAEIVVTAARDVDGVNLDFTVASLAAVDQIIENFRSEGLAAEQIAETLFCFGCYVGEVFVVQAGGSWRPTEATSMAGLASAPMVMETAKTVCNPIDKALKRFQNGEEDSVSYFYWVFTSS